MTTIAELREQIDQVDDQIARLLDQRTSLVEQIASVKRAEGVAPRDEGREQAVLARLAGRAGARFPEEALRAVYREIMAACLALHGPRAARPPGSS